MESFDTALRQVFLSSDQRRLLRDPEYFLDQLASVYRPEWKADCQLMERGIRVGAGQIVQQFLDQNAAPSPAEKQTFISMLQQRAGLTADEARQVVRHLTRMAFPEKKAQWLGSAKTMPWAARLHPALSLLYVVLIIISLISVGQEAQRSVSRDPLGAITSAGGMMLVGNMIKPQLFLIAIGTIFSCVGLFIRRSWPYLTGAIIQSVASLAGITVEVLQPIILICVVVLIVLGYMAFAQTRKLGM